MDYGLRCAMTLVMAWWALAMVSGLSWAPLYTGLCTAATLLAFLWAHPSALPHWAGWLQGGALGVTPWLLAAQRQREQRLLAQLHAEEARQMSQVAGSARSLLSLQHSTQTMETQIGEITDLYHVTKETARALHLDELFSASLTIAPRLLNAQGLRLIDLSGEAPRVLRAVRLPDGRMAGADPTPLLEMERAIITRATAARRCSSATADGLGCAFPEGLSRVAWAPLSRGQRAAAILIADELPEDQMKTLAVVADQLALQFSRITLYRQVEALAVTDALTGLSVRGRFMERAREELERSARHGFSCALLMTDLDLFKQKNDTFGHLVGDVILKEVARLLQANLRDIDLIARFGGEEFILLLVETSAEQALPVAQRLKQLVEVHPIRAYDELVTQTVSIGIAGFPEHADNLDALIERADQALYAAKQAGRNRVICA